MHDIGALVIAALTLAGHRARPRHDRESAVHRRAGRRRFVNLILLGYGLPAVLRRSLALITRGVRPQAYSAVAAVTAVALALAYLSLEVRTLYHGPVLNRGPTTDAEQYTYSAVWLAFGVALLLVGICLRSQAGAARLRRGGHPDRAQGVPGRHARPDRHLPGLSFIGLGLVLLGIGWLYQRLLFPRRAPAPSSPA